MSKDNKVKKSLKFSFLESIFSASMSGLVNDYITPYALAFKATTRQVGALTAVPFFATSLTQLKAADITEGLKSRKKMIGIFVFLNALMLMPITLIPYWFGNNPVLFLIIFMTLFTVFNALVSPVYSALLSEYVPSGKRGRYFGWRSRISAIIMISSSLIAGLILQHFKNDLLKGFLIILSAALVFRFISWYFLCRMHEPPFMVAKASYFSFLDFVKKLRESNFGRFVLFVSCLQFCIQLASPFFPVFMIKDLKLSYVTYTILVSTVTAVQILTIGRWGKVADKAGNLKVLKFTTLLISSLPLWWLVSHNPVYLFFAQVVSGFAWAGFSLCGSNFILDAVTPQKRIRCIAYFNVFVGLAVFAGGIIGGQLASNLPNVFGYRLLTLFLISSSLRFLTVFLLSGKIKEVRATEELSTREMLFRVIGIKRITD